MVSNTRSKRKIFYVQAFSACMFGAALAWSIGILFSLLSHSATNHIYATTYGPWLEEGTKLLLALFLIRTVAFPLWGIPLIGISFGFAEGLMYVVSRGYASITTYSAHIVFALVMTACFLFAQKAPQRYQKWILYSLAFLLAGSLHLFYNLYVSGLTTLPFLALK